LVLPHATTRGVYPLPGAERSGAERSGAERSGAERSGAERSGPELPTITKVEVEVIPPPHANGLFLYELSNEGFNLVNSFPNSHQAGEFIGVTFHCIFNRMKRGSIWLFSTVFLTVYPSGLLCRAGG
jgi:hypothetical protein